ncbi:bifunctional hydroxymethylpyrimidine kinase/phosphomethylpyrimidine kinase [Butyrivibrio sp. AE3004]|uniref:bifunctional hydroxymethylpyrimidine kinase/phosphomethylpyrimidine kinase n=1 Tax=Butyrivibrio sp. AE3004 TaxID=1506994 RepID=UPI0004942ED1|nr:bifunctional hydroxymethylpyrimidine kinase/phosphomethylpyrimidine kinase [Butyrivibrio sp. AE3004]
MKQKTVLTIAGSDPSGGAGIQADLKTMEAHDVFGMSVITALTAQNTMGVSGIMQVPKEFIIKQTDAVCSDILPDAVKIGMLPDVSAMEAVNEMIDKYELKNVVLDPVLSSTSGTEFSRKEALDYLKNRLFCKCMLITPNIPEAEILSQMKISSKEDMENAAKKLSSEFLCSVLIKGGHSCFDEAGKATDLLCLIRGGEVPEYIWMSGNRLNNPNTHGTGCTLSSAIASNLAKGKKLETSVRKAKEYIERCIGMELDLGKGRGPLFHNVQMHISVNFSDGDLA